MKIFFIGTTNAMPMAYAIELKKLNYDVKYIVDVASDNMLSRPEFHYDSIKYPYPNWIIEIKISKPSIKALYPYWGYKKIIDFSRDGDVYFLSDWYISIARFLPKNAKVIILPHGADLDSWCAPQKAIDIAKSGAFSSLWRIKKIIAEIIIRNMRLGLQRADAITYFPKGFNKDGDEIIDFFRKKKQIKIIRRYDVNLNNLNLKTGGNKNKNQKFVICSPVRFDFILRDGVSNKYLKGNDLIIKAIGEFYRKHEKNIEIIFFNKGRDILDAKKMCDEEGISHLIKWSDTVPLGELLEKMSNSDVCFDQVGKHWMGAVGVYALYLDVPLITNYRPEIMDDFISGFNPIFQATKIEEIVKHLVDIRDNKELENIKINSRDFAIRNFSVNKVLDEYMEFIK